MTRECAPGGVPTAEMAGYYRRRAEGGTGLIITEGAAPDPPGAFSARVPRLYGQDAIVGWRAVVDAVHAEGAGILAQIWHVGAFEPSLVGMRDDRDRSAMRLGPSGIAGPGRPMGRAMSDADIRDAIGAYAAATAAACRAGFDGVEIHAAHGYLPDQFLWQETNRRSDRYGGSRRNRCRFLSEVLAACRRELGEHRVLSCRISQWKQLDYAARIADLPAELAVILEAIAASGADLIHCSTRRYWEPAFAGSELPLAGWMRKLSGLPVIAVGSVTLDTDFKAPGGKLAAAAAPAQVRDLGRRIAAGEFDLVAIGRALLANPDWARLVEAGQADRLRPFTRAVLDRLV